MQTLENQTRARRSLRLGRLTLIAVLLACLPAFLVTPGHAAGPGGNAASPALVNTGDTLFDRYALAVDQRIEATTVEQIAEVKYAAAVPDTTLAAWENEFGADPRYWELRYFCAAAAKPGAALAPGFSAPADFLKEARKRGVASANTLMLLYPEMQREYNSQLDKQPETDAELAQSIAVMQHAEKDELELLDAAIALGANEAWPYYARAMYWFDLGEEDRGIAELEAGNAAPINVLPRPWPLPYIAEAVCKSRPPGSSAVCGAVTLASPDAPLYILTRLMTYTQDTRACCNLDGKLERLNAWNQFGCRLYESAPDLSSYGLQAVIFTGVAFYYVKNIEGDFSPEQQQTLQHIRGAITIAREIMSDRWDDKDPANEQAFDNPPGSAHEAARRGILPIYGGYGPYAAVNAILADLRQVHYPSLELPECMLKYEAMTEERAKAYRAED
jgi:hypothetical protein